LHQRPTDPRLLRLFDLAPHETIKVLCQCNHMIVSFGPGVMQRTRRVPSDTLIYDLQFRLRCTHCNARRGFKIWIEDTRPHTDRQFVGDPDIVIVDPT
jgi:hypothetical protein